MTLPTPTPTTPAPGLHQVGARRFLVEPRPGGLAVRLLPPGSRTGRVIALHSPAGLRITGNGLDSPAGARDAVRNLFGIVPAEVA